MTESAAILIWLADCYPDAGLAPPATDERRPAFLRYRSSSRQLLALDG
jgi:GST-like protein